MAYELFARFYDDVMDDPRRRGARVLDWITTFRPDARSLLELGCGTGAILNQLGSIPSLTGLDRSAEMLALASSKVPGARLLRGDMASFALGVRFDVIVSVFDTVNHLLDFEAWQSMFEAVHEHLDRDGLFIFDVNTVAELRRLGGEQPWTYDFDGNVAIMDVSYENDGVSLWDIRIFEHLDGARYVLHHEQIGELAVPLARIREALDARFQLLDEIGEDGGPADEHSIKVHFAYRRRR